jgi:agmatinase
MSNDKPSPATAAFSDLAFTRTSPYGSQAEPTYAGATSFLRRRYTKDLEGVDVAVIGVPFDVATTGRPGTRFGPRAIRAASTMLAWCPPYAWAADPLDKLHVIDWGDVFFDSGNIAAAPALIRDTYRTISGAGVKPLTLGGDHFISYPILQALAEKHGPLSLIHFDAHSDTWADDGVRIDHGTMFFQAAKTGIVDPSRSIQLGMRTFNEEKHGYEVPGTGTPVVGGFDTHTALEFIRGLKGIHLVGADVVEVSPPFDHAEITALAGASIAHEMLGLFAGNSA